MEDKQVFEIKVGNRVRFWYGGLPWYGILTRVDGPWVTVKVEDDECSRPAVMEKKFIQDPDSPLPEEPDTNGVPF